VVDYFGWRPYVSVGARRRQAARLLGSLKKSGREISPVQIEGRRIATTFWGKAWCENLERYSDFANRLPRGRTYVRNGSVVDLQVAPGRVSALVSGSEVYEVEVDVGIVPGARWKALRRDCTDAIDSVVELLEGRLSAGVMARVCAPKTGLFPGPKEISFRCSCPDWAGMCKHVSAVLYGVGARLDSRPELLFLLRSVDPKDLIAKAESGLRSRKARGAKVLHADNLSEIFGIDIASPSSDTSPRARRKAAARRTP
jgi:uncharacterized Zn finger protein